MYLAGSKSHDTTNTSAKKILNDTSDPTGTDLRDSIGRSTLFTNIFTINANDIYSSESSTGDSLDSTNSCLTNPIRLTIRSSSGDTNPDSCNVLSSATVRGINNSALSTINNDNSGESPCKKLKVQHNPQIVRPWLQCSDSSKVTAIRPLNSTNDHSIFLNQTTAIKDVEHDTSHRCKDDNKQNLRNFLEEKTRKCDNPTITNIKLPTSGNHNERTTLNEDSRESLCSDDVGGEINEVQARTATTEGRTTRLRPRSYRSFLLTKEHRTRAYLKKRSHTLGRWFITHFTHPYPSKEQKDKLAHLTNMTKNQVSEWFGNMRRRIREVTRGLKLTWEEKVRRYNGLISGKSEPLPIMPHDAINSWTAESNARQQTSGRVEDTSDSVQLNNDKNTSNSSAAKFKTNLLKRYLTDASSPISGLATLKTSNIAQRPKAQNKTKACKSTVPIARVNPWSCARPNNIKTKPSSVAVTLKNHIRGKTKQISADLQGGTPCVGQFCRTPPIRTYSKCEKQKIDVPLKNIPRNASTSTNFASVEIKSLDQLGTSALPVIYSAPVVPSMIMENNAFRSCDQTTFHPYFTNFTPSNFAISSAQITHVRNMLNHNNIPDIFKHKIIPVASPNPFQQSFVRTDSSSSNSNDFHSSDEMSAAYTLMQLQKNVTPVLE